MTTVKVKPLEWRPEPPYHVARVFGNVYAVEAWDGGATLSGVGGRRDFKTLDEAKAAAQQDYETRIMSALAPQAGDNAEEPVRDRAISIICKEAEELGYCEDDIAVFRRGDFDGDDLLTLQAVERALAASEVGR